MCLQPGEMQIKTSGRVINALVPTDRTLDGKLSTHDGSVFHTSGVMATEGDLNLQLRSLGLDSDSWVRITGAVPLTSGTFPVMYGGKIYSVEVRPYGNEGFKRVVNMTLFQES